MSDLEHRLAEHKRTSKQSTFTGRRLDLLKCVRFELSAIDYCVASAIAEHINEKTGVAAVSDATIAIEANCSVRTVTRSRDNLRAAGWLDWQRRQRKTNLYRLRFDRVAEVLIAIKAAVGASQAHRRRAAVILDLSRVTEEHPKGSLRAKVEAESRRLLPA